MSVHAYMRSTTILFYPSTRYNPRETSSSTLHLESFSSTVPLPSFRPGLYHRATYLDRYLAGALIKMMRNSLQPRPRRFTQPSSIASSPPATSQRSHATTRNSVLSSSRGIKRARPSSPFRQTSTRSRTVGHASSSSSAHSRPRPSEPDIPIGNFGLPLHSALPEPQVSRPVDLSEGNGVDAEDEVEQRRPYSDEDEEEDKGIIMAVDYRGKRLGCTFYTEEDETLWFVNDIQVSMFGPEGGAAKEVLESCEFPSTPSDISNAPVRESYI